MANSRLSLQLLFLGLLASPAFFQKHPCDLVKDASRHGSFSLDVRPQTYIPGKIYTVTVSGIDNNSSVILQAWSANSRSEGLWEMGNEPISCSGVEYLVPKDVSGNGARARWTSPENTSAEAVHIRAFVTFANGTTLLQTHTLRKALTTPGPSSATHSASGPHRPTFFSNSTNAHLNTTMVNWASSHQEHQGPYSGAVSQTRSVLMAALQFLPVFLGFKLLS